MGAGKILTVLAALLTILGTYVFASFLMLPGYVGSGIGFILNLGDLFANADAYSTLLSLNIILYFLILVLFIIFLASGVLILTGLKNRFAGLIFSLFPLAIGLMFIFLVYTDILGIKTAFFTIFFTGEHYGNVFPILVSLGDLALGTYLMLGGGVLGVIGAFAGRD